jgi:hypothetical protein
VLTAEVSWNAWTIYSGNLAVHRSKMVLVRAMISVVRLFVSGNMNSNVQHRAINVVPKQKSACGSVLSAATDRG